MSDDVLEVQFLRGDAGDDFVNLANDPKLALLATCIISQQSAGFEDRKGRPVADLREVKCPTCGAPGFNTGWGYWKHACGAEVLTDGEESEPCNAKQEPTR